MAGAKRSLLVIENGRIVQIFRTFYDRLEQRSSWIGKRCFWHSVS